MAQTLRRSRAQAVATAAAAALSWAALVPASGATAPRLTTAVVDPGLRAAHGTVGVIVQGARSTESAVVRMGGRITHELPLIGGFSAKVPASDIPTIAHLRGVTVVTLDRSTHVQGNPPGSTNNIPSVYKHVTNSDRLGKLGGDGRGVTVALIDTGVTPLPDVASSLVTLPGDPLGQTTTTCVNFTAESTCDDSYGHGTFMAGIIAGSGVASNGKYVGMAPHANIISLKIAGADGSSDVSTIIAAIQWVVANQSTYNIRVLNLSLGTDSTQSYTIDPLDYAAEKAWQAGIVVNVAASNRGPSAQTISDPANDPFVITVGAIDDRGTNGLGDDLLPDFSSRGPTATDGLAKPDVVAPGAHIVSLAAPGASITTQFPPTMAAPYRRGSGTSMANAVVTGLVADMLSLQPTATPDRVKYELTSTAHHDASNDRMAVGSGIVDGWAALNAGSGVANVGVQPSAGTGSIAASRGSVQLLINDGTGEVLDASSGNTTGLLLSVNAAMLLSDPTGSNWWGSNWWGSNWWGSNWWGSNWWGSNWWGSNWWGGDFSGASMYGTPDSTQDYGSNWWGGAWYGAWDQ